VRKAPPAMAAVLGVPIFFCSLMAASLAVEKPHVYQWRSGGRLLTTWHPPTNGNEAKIWLLALAPPALLVLVGVAAAFVPYGVYVVCCAAVVDVLAVTHRLDMWAAHHAARFPNGVDLIPRSNPASDKINPGEWEGKARDTALSGQHWTVAIAVAAALLMAGIAIRRRWLGAGSAPAPPPLEGVHAPDATPPGLGGPL
jgi:hypothetical protein